jgi:hypothetical protein
LSPDGTSLVLEFDITEPLVVPPFEYTAEASTKSLFGINTIQITANLANVHRMLSLAELFPGSMHSVTSVTLQPTVQELSLNYVTPPPHIARDGPFTYGYSNVQGWSNTLSGSAVSPGGSITGVSGTYDLPVVPDCFLVWVTYSDTDRNNPTISLPDLFLPIQSIQVSFGTKAGLLSSASVQELYNNNIRNGTDFPYWAMGQLLALPNGATRRGAGNILIIDTAADLSLPEGLTPGMSVRTQFSVTQITCVNNSILAHTGLQLCVVALTKAMLVNMAGSSSQTLGGVLSAEIHDTMPLKSEVARLQREGGYGGKFSFGHLLKQIGHTVAPIAKMARPFVKFIPGVGEVADRALHAIGQGYDCEPSGKRSLRDYF